MNIPIPTAKDLLAEIPLHCVIHPLERPRLNYMSKRVYQPLDNQLELLAETRLYGGAYIYTPVFIEIMIVHAGVKDDVCVSKAHGDIDNQVKAIHDALVKANIILDDRLIVTSQASRAYGEYDFCLIRIWSVSPTTETFPWDLNTARIRSKQPKPPEELWPTPKPQSKSSRRGAAKLKS